MRISVFGAGYVGAVTAACLSDDGHSVIAVDVSPEKVAMINRGQAPIVEPGLQGLLGAGIKKGLLTATTDAREALERTEVTIICVGTPSNAVGDLDLSYVASATAEIAKCLKQSSGQHTLIYRSTMLPGSMKNLVIPILRKALGDRMESVGLAVYPEFLREGTAINDYGNPGAIVIGAEDEETVAVIRQLTENISAPEVLVDIPTAETIKYVNNCWHACKIAFANEIGNVCRASGVDGDEVMRAVCADTRLNLSAAYMRPGMAFGGSCLPKDLRALRRHAAKIGLQTPMLNGISRQNEEQLARAFELIVASGRRKIALLGLSFKEGTDDLRESPLVTLAERLVGKGYELRIVDRNVRLAYLTGANLSYVEAHLPHLAQLIEDDLDAALDDAEVILLGQNTHEFVDAVSELDGDKRVVDLVRMKDRPPEKAERPRRYANGVELPASN